MEWLEKLVVVYGIDGVLVNGLKQGTFYETKPSLDMDGYKLDDDVRCINRYLNDMLHGICRSNMFGIVFVETYNMGELTNIKIEG